MVKRYLNCRIPCGVRQVFRIKEIITRHLNPRTPYGVRRTRERCEGDNGNLNPRTPYGVRLSKKEIRMFSNYLNPRTPYGVRRNSQVYVPQNRLLKSTHSIRSATGTSTPKYLPILHLNPRTPYGVRQKQIYVLMGPDNLNPRTPYGVRPIWNSLWRTGKYLNPRTPYGVRQQFCIKNIAFLYRLHLFFWTNCFVRKKYYCFFKGFLLSIKCESPRVFMFTSHSHYISIE